MLYSCTYPHVHAGGTCPHVKCYVLMSNVGVTVSIGSPLALGLDCQVFVQTICQCIPSPTRMRKSSSEGTQMASALAIIGLIFPIIAIIVYFSVADSLNLRAADHETIIMRYKANIRTARAAYGDCIRAVIVSNLTLLVLLQSQLCTSHVQI